jgi:hypothetical protein
MLKCIDAYHYNITMHMVARALAAAAGWRLGGGEAAG